MYGSPEPPLELLKRDDAIEQAAKSVFPEAKLVVGVREDGSCNILITLQIYAASDFQAWTQLPVDTKASIVDYMHSSMMNYMKEYVARYP